MSKSCEACLESAANPPRASLNVWDWPDGPNRRIHADFLGPLEGHMYLLIIDAFSKWVDVKEMKNITSESTIDVFREYFSTWRLPSKLMTDNGPSFCSELFETFLKQNGVYHVKTAPYHPASNGAAETAVKSFKSKFKLIYKELGSRHTALNKYLFHVRSTPHCTTGVSPAELQMGRKFRSRWDFRTENTRSRVEQKQSYQKRFFHENRITTFDKSEVIMAKYYAHNNWRKSEILEQSGPVTYNVVTNDGRIWKRHTDQLNLCNLAANKNNDQNVNAPVVPRNAINIHVASDNKTVSYRGVPNDSKDAEQAASDDIITENIPTESPVINNASPIKLRRSARTITVPLKYRD